MEDSPHASKSRLPCLPAMSFRLDATVAVEGGDPAACNSSKSSFLLSQRQGKTFFRFAAVWLGEALVQDRGLFDGVLNKFSSTTPASGVCRRVCRTAVLTKSNLSSSWLPILYASTMFSRSKLCSPRELPVRTKRTIASSNTFCCAPADDRVHTLTCCNAHFSGVHTLCAHTHVSCVHIHAWLKLFAVRMSSLPSSCLLRSHHSPIFLAVPARSLRDQSRLRPHRRTRPHDPAELSRPQSAGQAHSGRG